MRRSRHPLLRLDLPDARVVSILEAEVRAHPRWADYQNRWGLCLLTLDRPREAAAAFRRALQINPRYAWARLNLGAALFLCGEREEGMRQADHCAEPAPPARVLTLAWMDYLNEDSAAAAERLRVLPAPLEERLDVRALQGVLFRGRVPGRSGRARRLRDRLASEDPRLLDRWQRAFLPGASRFGAVFPGMHQLWLGISTIEARLGRPGRARRAALTGYLHFTSAGAYLNQLGFLATLLGQDARARRCHARAMRVEPDSPSAPAALARLWAARGNLSHAARYLDRALELAPGYPDLLRMKGQIEEARGRDARALEYFRRALDVNPAYRTASIDEANVLFRLGRHEEALPRFRELVRFGFGSADVLVHLARCEEAVGEVREARRHYLAALRRNPRELLAHYRLSIMDGRAGKTRQARERRRKILRLAREPVIREYYAPLLRSRRFRDDEAPLRLDRAA